MKKQRFKLGRMQTALAAAAITVGVAGIGAIAQAAVAPANSSITNQATVTYEDSVGNPYNSTSNSASVTVAQIFAATIAQDNLASVSGPAQTVYSTHTITNNGNGTDVFHVTVTQDAAGSTDSGNFTSIQAYLDGSATAGAGTVTTNNCAGTNGQVDSGEVLLDTDTAALTNTITIPAGQQACIVVAAQVPAGALDTQTYELTVTAQAENGNAGTPQANSVGDLTDGNGAIGGGANGLDGTDDTNNNRVTVTANAALQITKTANHTPATATTDGQIDYTIEVQNTGAATADEVFIFDGLPANTALVAGSVQFNGSTTVSGSDFLQGTLTNITEANFDTLVTANANPVDLNGDNDAADTTETDFGFDLDSDTSTDATTKQGIFVYDHAIPANTTVTLTFSVTYSRTLAFNTNIRNFARFAGDANGDNDTSNGGTPDTGEVGSAGPALVTVPRILAVDLNDTAGNGDATTDGNGDNLPDASNNNGLDDDVTDDDVQTVNTVPEGGTVIFQNIITNNGNASETFNLSFLNDGGAAWKASTTDAYPAVLAPFTGTNACDGTAARAFPAGTTFRFTDASGSSVITSVVVAAGASTTVRFEAVLPSGTNGPGEYCASTAATHNTNTSVVNYKLERLAHIAPAAVDLANSDNSAASGDTEPFVSVGSITTTSPITNQVGNPGDTVTFDLYIRNDGGVGESYTLSSGATWNGGAQGDATFAAGVLGAIHSGWSVVFKDNDPATATANGTVITSTDTVPAGGAIRVLAEVTIPATATATQSNFISDIDGGGNDNIDDNADGDGDYPIIFRIVGNSTGSTDVILDSVDVNEVESIVAAPNQTGQVEPGGTITYIHTITNGGNTTEDVAISVADDRDDNPVSEPDDFNPSIIRVDTDCDGTVDTVLSSVTGTTNNVCLTGDTAGNPTGDYNSTAGTPTLNLAPGQQVSVQITVSSKTSAANSVVDTTTLTATWDVGTDNDTNTATDQTTVVTVQIRALKYAARDVACDGTPDEAFTQTGATATAPGQCIIWQIVIENQSAQPARNVVIQDAAPAFTTYQAGSLQSCAGNAGLTATAMPAACPGADGTTDCALTDAQDVDAGCAATHDAHESSGSVSFYVGHVDGANPAPNGSTPGSEAGGTLSPSEFVTVRFRVQLDVN